MTKVYEGSFVDKAGLKTGDLITEVGGATLYTAGSIVDELKPPRPGRVLAFSVKRGNQFKPFFIRLYDKDFKNSSEGNTKNTVYSKMNNSDYMSALRQLAAELAKSSKRPISHDADNANWYGDPFDTMDSERLIIMNDPSFLIGRKFKFYWYYSSNSGSALSEKYNKYSIFSFGEDGIFTDSHEYGVNKYKYTISGYTVKLEPINGKKKLTIHIGYPVNGKTDGVYLGHSNKNYQLWGKLVPATELEVSSPQKAFSACGKMIDINQFSTRWKMRDIYYGNFDDKTYRRSHLWVNKKNSSVNQMLIAYFAIHQDYLESIPSDYSSLAFKYTKQRRDRYGNLLRASESNVNINYPTEYDGVLRKALRLVLSNNTRFYDVTEADVRTFFKLYGHDSIQTLQFRENIHRFITARNPITTAELETISNQSITAPTVQQLPAAPQQKILDDHIQERPKRRSRRAPKPQANAPKSVVPDQPIKTKPIAPSPLEPAAKPVTPVQSNDVPAAQSSSAAPTFQTGEAIDLVSQYLELEGLLTQSGAHVNWLVKNYPNRGDQWKRASAAGDPYAQYFIALVNLHGVGNPKNVKLAIQTLSKAAEGGVRAAQNDLGSVYRIEKTVENHLVFAKKWYTKSANQGYIKAQVSLAEMYSKGELQPHTGNEVMYWLEKAATQGHHFSQNQLGFLLLNQGKHSAALPWFTKAAKGGLALAQSNLALVYLKGGNGVPVNQCEAFKWYGKAAKQGDANGLNGLGCCYQYGICVGVDLEQAVKFYKASADLGNVTAKNNLKKLGK